MTDRSVSAALCSDIKSCQMVINLSEGWEFPALIYEFYTNKRFVYMQTGFYALKINLKIKSTLIFETIESSVYTI